MNVETFPYLLIAAGSLVCIGTYSYLYFLAFSEQYRNRLQNPSSDLKGNFNQATETVFTPSDMTLGRKRMPALAAGLIAIGLLIVAIGFIFVAVSVYKDNPSFSTEFLFSLVAVFSSAGAAVLVFLKNLKES